MSLVGQPERATQDRVIALFRAELGYRDPDDGEDEEQLLDPQLFAPGEELAEVGAAPAQGLLDLGLGEAAVAEDGAEEVEGSLDLAVDRLHGRIFSDMVGFCKEFFRIQRLCGVV